MVRVARKRIVVGLLNRRSLLWREKGRHGGSESYRGAYSHTAQELRRALVDCGLRHVLMRSAIYLSNGSGVACPLKRCVPDTVLYGGFFVGVRKTWQFRPPVHALDFCAAFGVWTC
jgi:hypothetical protein